MGGGRGGGYSSDHERQIKENFRSLEQKFGSLTNGQFGTPGSSEKVRRITSENPQKSAAEFFKIATRGSEKVWEERPGVYRAKFKDNTHITYRLKSKSDNSPAIDIRTSSSSRNVVRSQKIHFIEDQRA